MGEQNKSREATLRQSATQATMPPPAPELGQIYRDHHKRVLSAAYRVTGNAQDAEDVLQTVFMRLVRREGGSPLSDSPGSYLHRAAINAALDVVRSREASRTSPLEDVEPSLSARAEDGSGPDPGRRRDPGRDPQGAGQDEPEVRRDLRPALLRGLRQPRDRADAGRVAQHDQRDPASHTTEIA